MIKLLKLNLRLRFSHLPAFVKWMLVIERNIGLTRRKNLLSLQKKNTKLNCLKVSPLYQKQAPSLLIGIFKRPRAIVVIDGCVIQQVVSWPPV